MSNGASLQSPPNIWSYFAYSKPTSRRKYSTPLPFRNRSDDPFEKHNRHFAGRANMGYAQDAKVSWMNQSKRARYFKVGGILAFLLIMLVYFAPKDRPSVRHFVGDYAPIRGGDIATDPSLGTTKCIQSYSKDKPLIQYALMIDAGSTGSRIHVYRFNNCGPTPELEDEIFEQTAKREGGSGLSSYKGDAEGAAKSLDGLMDVAVKNVPDKLKPCTPVAVKATAGLRKLGPEMSDKILQAVRNRLATVYPFPVVSEAEHGVEVMEGTDEGVYAWITVNYLLGKIGGPDQTPTAAVFDLGGGSTQIVFEPTFPHSPSGGLPETLAEGDHKYNLTFGGRDFTLYQHSYLGYGLMAARESLHRSLIEALHSANPESKSWLSGPVSNPCLAPDTSREINIDLSSSASLAAALGPSVTVNMTGPPTGSPTQCRALAEKILRKEDECKISPCAFAGVHQPSLSKTFAQEDIYLFSYFYDRTVPLGMPTSFSLSELKDLAGRVCDGEKSGAWKVFESMAGEEGEGKGGVLEDLRGRPEWCLDLNFMLALLNRGYDIPMDREVRIAKKIRGRELGWCLGASLPLLSKESGWTCKIREVSSG